MEKIFQKNIPNHEASRQLAKELVEKYLKDEKKFTVFIEGTLGAGKTFLAKEMLENLGITENITSPTYALVNEYKTTKEKNFAHFDFYRLEEAGDFFARGFQDIAGDSNTSSFVEWPEQIDANAKSAFTGTIFVLKIEFGIGVGMRKITWLKK